MSRSKKIILGMAAATVAMWAYMAVWISPVFAATYDLKIVQTNCARLDPYRCDTELDVTNNSGASHSVAPFICINGTCYDVSDAKTVGNGATVAYGLGNCSGGSNVDSFNDVSYGTGICGTNWGSLKHVSDAYFGWEIKVSGSVVRGPSYIDSGLNGCYGDGCDPRPDPVTTVVLPAATEYTTGTNVPFQFDSNVDSSTYPDEADNAMFDMEMQRDDSGFHDVLMWTDRDVPLNLDDGFYALMGYPDAATIPFTFTPGDYRIRARSKFVTSYGSWSDWTDFSYASVPFGGGGGGSWGGGSSSSGDGSSEDWNGFFDTVDSLKPTCNILTWTASQTGACMWEWVRYAVVPPADVTFNFVKRPFDVLMTRWPLIYLTGSWTALQTGMVSGSTCPIPQFFSGSDDMLGQNLPTVDVCSWLSPIPTAINANTTAANAFVVFIYCVFVVFCIDEAVDFFE